MFFFFWWPHWWPHLPKKQKNWWPLVTSLKCTFGKNLVTSGDLCLDFKVVTFGDLQVNFWERAHYSVQKLHLSKAVSSNWCFSVEEILKCQLKFFSKCSKQSIFTLISDSTNFDIVWFNNIAVELQNVFYPIICLISFLTRSSLPIFVF